MLALASGPTWSDTRRTLPKRSTKAGVYSRTGPVNAAAPTGRYFRASSLPIPKCHSNAKRLLPENPEQSALLRRRRWRGLLLGLLLWWRRRKLRGRPRRRLSRLRRLAFLRGLLRRRRLSRRIGRRGDDRGLRPLTIVQPDVVDRMLHAMQARACRVHPARKDP